MSDNDVTRQVLRSDDDVIRQALTLSGTGTYMTVLILRIGV
jgi:hypothetical protein